MRHPVYTLVIIGLISLCNPIFSQVKTKIFTAGVPIELLPIQNNRGVVKKIKASAEFNTLKQAVREGKSKENENKFAIPTLVNLNFMGEATEVNDNGILTYSLAINIEEALNISVQFGEFYLSKNAVLCIYTSNEITDSITAKENNNP